MKEFGWILVFLAALGVLLAVPVVARRSEPWPDCTGRVVIVKGARAEALECVCLSGRLSTCFNPGP